MNTIKSAKKAVFLPGITASRKRSGAPKKRYTGATIRRSNGAEARPLPLTSPSRVILLTATALTVLLLLLRPKIMTDTVPQALEFFYRSVLPTLLPFMISSRLMIACGFGQLCRKIFGRTLGIILGRGGADCSSAFCLGAVSIFTIGAKSVCELYRRGECEREDAELMLGVCSNAGLGFTAAGIGGAMWGDTAFGIKLWGISLFSSLFSGALLARRGNSRNSTSPVAENTQSFSVSQTVTEAIADSVFSALKVCGALVFFELLSAVFAQITAPLFIPPAVNASLLAFLEFSSGSRALAATASGSAAAARCAKLLTAVAVAFSGVSVHTQVASFALPAGLKMKKYYIVKALSSAFAAVISAFLCVIGAI